MQKKVTIIIGEPATGKSTLIRRLMEGQSYQFRQLKWVPHHINLQRNSAILGDYTDQSETYPGSDRLSMAVQPHARQWIKESSPDHVLMEGDRLGNMKFIKELIVDGHDVKVIRLMANETTRKFRSNLQQREQDDKFLRSRKTKILNMHNELAALPGMAYQAVPHINSTDTRFIVSNLMRSDSERRI